MNKLAQKEALEIFEYRDGILYWKVKASQKKPGDIAGCINNCGYPVVRYKRKLYLSHRIIWLMFHGYWSENLIDHIDRDQTNNKIENLREASNKCNVRNNGTLKNSTSGVKGVSFNKRVGRFEAYIENNGVRKHLGMFKDIVSAARARLSAEIANGWSTCNDNGSAYNFLIANGEAV